MTIQLEIKTLDKKQGLYTHGHIAVNEVILKFKEELVLKDDLKKFSSIETNDMLQISDRFFLNLKDDRSFFINHSCNPNCKIKIIGKMACLLSARNILPNEQLCFDYSTTSTDEYDDWSMKCNCGQWNCRKIISGFKNLSAKQQTEYMQKGMVPTYVYADKDVK